jgi:hypothetical protein
MVRWEYAVDVGKLHSRRSQQTRFCAVECRVSANAVRCGVPGTQDIEVQLAALVDEDRAQYNFPGYVRQYVLGMAYNRFWWNGLYTGIHAMHAFQTYRNDDGSKITNAYTLFMTYRLGYQLQFGMVRQN